MNKRSWDEFREAGLFWWINRSLHLFGWALVFAVDHKTNKVIDVYPSRMSYRGFDQEIEEEGFIKVTEYLNKNVPELLEEVNA